MPQPGQYLPHFIDWMERQAYAPPALKAPYRETIAHMKRANRSGVRFALDGMLRGVLPDKHPLIGSDLRPPYPITIVEYTSGPRQFSAVAEDLGTHVKLRGYSSRKFGDVSICPFEVRFEYVDHWAPIELRCWSRVLAESMADFQGETYEYILDRSAETLNQFASVYARLCAVLEKHDVELTDVEPDAKENRVRRVKGRAPLYTYKTLVIGKPKRRQRVGSGTHASPRSHLRRGYYRTSKKGVRHWVQACMVKGETPGFVHKDYRVEGGNTNG